MTAPDRHHTGTPPRWGIGDAVAGWVGAQIFAIIVGQLILTAFGYSSKTSTSDLPLRMIALVQLPLWVGLVAAPLYAARYKGLDLRRDLGFWMRPLDLAVGAVVGVAAQYLLVPAVSLPVLKLAGKSTQDLSKVAVNLTSKATDSVGVVLLVLIVVIAAPIVEELFYRGLLLRSIEKRWGTAWAVVGSAVVFGLSHFELLQAPALIAFGVVLALLAVKTGRLAPGIFAHMAFNAVAVITLLR